MIFLRTLLCVLIRLASDSCMFFDELQTRVDNFLRVLVLHFRFRKIGIVKVGRKTATTAWTFSQLVSPKIATTVFFNSAISSKVKISIRYIHTVQW